MTEIDFYDIIKATCLHPSLYTPTGSFFEAVSYLEGFGVGANVDNMSYHSKLTPFLKWVTKKFEVEEVIIDWPKFRQRFSTDSDTFVGLQNLYLEYISEQQ